MSYVNHTVMHLVLLALILMLTACENRHENAIARVNDQWFTVEAVKNEARDQGLPINAVTFRRVLDQMIQREAALAQIDSQSLLDDPVFKRSLSDFVLRHMQQAYEQKHVKLMQVSEEEISAWYQNNKQEFFHPSQRRVALIEWQYKEHDKAQVFKSAQQVLEKIRQEKSESEQARVFSQQAATVSSHRASRYLGGDVGFWSREYQQNGFDASLYNHVFLLNKISEVSELIETDEAFYVVKVTEIKTEYVDELHSVSASIKRQLALEKLSEIKESFQATLRRNSDIEVFEQSIAQLALHTPTHSQPSRPAGPVSK